MDKPPYSTLSQAWNMIEPTIRGIPYLPDPALRLSVYRDIWYAGTLAAAKLLVLCIREEDDEKSVKMLKSLSDELAKHDVEVTTRARAAVEDFLSQILEKGEGK